MAALRTSVPWWTLVCCVAGTCLLPASGCATTGDTKWIQVGKTTRTEVLERYGEPDLVRVSSDGELVTYGSVGFRSAQIPPQEVLVAEAAPEGKITFKPQRIVRGLGIPQVGAGTYERPHRELHFRYDTQGIVREVRE